MLLLFLGVALAQTPVGLFQALDLDHDGVLSKAEMIKIGSLYVHTGRSPEASQLDYLFSKLDTNQDGEIELAEYQARYPALAAPFQADPTPEQIHLALSGVDGMAVSWCSYIQNITTPPQPAAATVKYGTTSGKYDSSIDGVLRTYDVGLFGGWHGWISDVTLRPLQPGTKYFYVVGDGKHWSPERSFTQPNQGTAPTTMVVLGDQGTTIPVGFEVSKMMTDDLHGKLPFDVFSHVGDLCYATMAFGDDKEWELVWDQWGRQIADMSAYVPYMTSVGNHENVYNYTSYRNRFHMPGDVTGGEHNFWFSYSVGNIAFVSMSTEHPYDPGTPQYIFLDKELQRFNASRGQYPWIFLGGHRPLYSSEKSEYDQHCPGAHLLSVIEPLMRKYGVDAYVAGHMHSYERVHPCVNGSVVSLPDKNGVYTKPTSPISFVLGTGGVFLDVDAFIDKPTWSAFRSGDNWGYGRFTAHNSSLLEYQFYTLDGTIVDKAFLQK